MSIETPTATQSKAAKLFRASTRVNSLTGVRILGCGSYVPEKVVTNAELESAYGFEKGWIEQRTGILERRYVTEGQATSDLCVQAARKAIANGKVDPAEIDLVMVATFSPDYHCPSTACLVQEALGLDAPAVDLQAACSGFMYALISAAQYVATGNAQMALVIGADVNSRIVNPTDQRVAPLFGDGSGAVLIVPGDEQQGLICYQMGSDGSGASLLDRPLGGTRNPLVCSNLDQNLSYLQMDGRNVFKWAIQAVVETIKLVLEQTEMQAEDISLYALHQANIRIIDHAMQQLNIPNEKVFNNLQKYGNTSAGSIPIVLDEAHQQSLIQTGDTLLLSGFGAGLTWGTALLRW